MQRRHVLICAAAAAACMPGLSSAQAYPSKPITIIVPFAAGGGSDNIARLVAAKLSEKTGKTFVIDNRGGGGTNIGNDIAARAAPDGYTLLLGQFTLSANPFLYGNLRYKTEAFVPVVHIANAPTVLVVPATSPIKDVQGLIAAAKASPGKLNYGSGGAGTSVHLAAELFRLSTATSLTHVPYKGSAPAVTDLIGGQIDMIFDTSTSALPYIKGGRVRAIATAATQRLRALPDVPTFAEQGLKDFDVPAWYGLLGPAGFPAQAVQWLNGHVNEILKDPAMLAQLDGIGAIAVGGTPQQLGAFMGAQAARWERVIKESHIKLD